MLLNLDLTLKINKRILFLNKIKIIINTIKIRKNQTQNKLPFFSLQQICPEDAPQERLLSDSSFEAHVVLHEPLLPWHNSSVGRVGSGETNWHVVAQHSPKPVSEAGK